MRKQYNSASSSDGASIYDLLNITKTSFATKAADSSIHRLATVNLLGSGSVVNDVW